MFFGRWTDLFRIHPTILYTEWRTHPPIYFSRVVRHQWCTPYFISQAQRRRGWDTKGRNLLRHGPSIRILIPSASIHRPADESRQTVPVPVAAAQMVRAYK